MNIYVEKYACKTKTYDIIISLTNRVMIAIEIRNLGAELYWELVYVSLQIEMIDETLSFI